MHCRWQGVAAGLMVLTFSTSSARADEVASQADLAEMRALVLQLQDTVRAQQSQLDAQSETIERVKLLETPREAASGLSSFLSDTEFYGWVTSSYTYNVRNGGNNALVGQNACCFFHPDSNTFQVDQVWFGMDRTPTPESRGGFHIDLAYGKTASIQGGNAGFPGNDGVEIFAAYVSYLLDVGNGVQIDAGELWTLLGAEVVQAPDNFNITRGLVWGLQPVSYTGVLASTELGGGFSLAAGLVNALLTDTNADSDNNKAFTGQLSFSNDEFYGGVSAIYGSPFAPAGFEGDKQGILDVVLTADVSERLALWFNYDYNWTDDVPGGDINAHGFALAGRLALTDTLGAAIRGEYVLLDPQGGSDVDLWSLTGTLDKALTDHLTLRAELRYDGAAVERGSDKIFAGANGNLDYKEEILLLGEITFQF